MRQLLPSTSPSPDLDAAGLLRLHLDDERPTPPGRPWLSCNMVTSIDGATAVDGLSGEIGGPSDRLVFRALRATADVILVAGGTARSENYGPISLDEDAVEKRTTRGRAPTPVLAVISGSLDFDLDARLFDDDHRPLIFTSASSDAERRRGLEESAELVVFDDDRVQVSDVLDHLGQRHHGVVLCEGGPMLNGQLLRADLLDELFVTTGPLLVGGSSARMVSADEEHQRRMALDRLLLADDGSLFARWLRPEHA